MKIIKLVPLLILLLSTSPSFASFPIERTKNGKIILKKEVSLNSSIIKNEDDIKRSKIIALFLTLPPLGYFGLYLFYLGHFDKGIKQLIFMPLSIIYLFFVLLLNTKMETESYEAEKSKSAFIGALITPALLYLLFPFFDFFQILFGYLKPAYGYSF